MVCIEKTLPHSGAPCAPRDVKDDHRFPIDAIEYCLRESRSCIAVRLSAAGYFLRLRADRTLQDMNRLLANLHQAALGVASRFRNYYYAALGVRLDGYVWMRRISIPRCWPDIRLGKNVALDDGVVIVIGGPPRIDKIVIGANTYVNRYTIFDAHQQLYIGERVMVGPHCYFTDADHSTDPETSVQAQPMRCRPLIIEDEVWIGANVTVLPGVRIGRGAVVGAGAVVTRDVPSLAIVVGCPARVRRYRDGRNTADDSK
jgi:acetyltransferase-like isoleucine patch superfamily enzyme